MVEHPDLDRFVGREVVDDSGTPVGTVVDVDRAAEEFSLEPSPELDVNTWKSLGWHANTEYDADWEYLDYDAWRDGEEDVTVGFDEWPFTLSSDRLDDAGDQLRVD